MIRFWSLDLQLIHLLSIWHFVQPHVFWRWLFEFLSISVIWVNLSLRSRRATPPFAVVGKSMKIWNSGNCLSSIPNVVCLISVRQIISNSRHKHLRYMESSFPLALKLSIFTWNIFRQLWMCFLDRFSILFSSK